MTMFPLHPRPFKALSLSPERCQEYEAAAMAVLHETLAEYHDFAHKQQRKINKKRWKEVKTKGNVTVYKDKQRENSTASHTAGSSSSNNSSAASGNSGDLMKGAKEWSLPKLLGIGTIVGSLEDVMYGNLSPNMDCTLIKTVYMEDEIVDGDVLYTLRSPSREDPFQNVSLQWFVKGHNATINTVVRPRDIVDMEAQGLYSDPSTGEKIGYHVMQSLDLPECPPLTSLGIVRAELSSCYLYRQLSNGTVEMYMKTFVDFRGSVPDAIALITAANGLIGTWKSVWCSQNKKLAWLLKDAVVRRQQNDDHSSVKVKINAKHKQCCSLCLHSFSTFRRAVVCELCHAVVCNKCRTVRKLTYALQRDTVRVTTAFCNPCIVMANDSSALEIARSEFDDSEAERRVKAETMGSFIGELAESQWGAESASGVETIDDWEARHRVPTEDMRPSAIFARDTADAGEDAIAAAMHHQSSQEYLTNDIRNDKKLIPFRIDQKEVSLTKQVARGGYGVIYRGSYKGAEVAVKQMLPDAWRDEAQLASFMDEIRLCASLHHPKIVQFVGITWTSLRDLSVVIEYMAGGDLQNVLYKHAQSIKPLTPSPLEWTGRWTTAELNSKAVIAGDVAEAFVYLHSFDAQIIHRDLKAKNVLLDATGNAKLSDFGISREVDLEETMTSAVGTSAWIAPEVLRGDRYDEKADIYSLGVLLVELDRCSHPYAGEEPLLSADGRNVRLTNMQIALLVCSGRLQPSPLATCPSHLKQLISWCLNFAPGDRPSAMQVHYELRQILAMP